jgi:hypothetical protein
MSAGCLVSEHGGDLALGGAVDARVRPARVPAVEIRLGLLDRLKAQALERGLRVGDGRLDLPLSIRIFDPTGPLHGTVVGEQIAIERVQRGIVDVRLEDTLAEIVEDDDLDRPAQPAKRFLVQLGPASRTDVKSRSRTLLRLKPKVKTNKRVRRYLRVSGCRTIGPVP